jgi:hypothetical protein
MISLPSHLLKSNVVIFIKKRGTIEALITTKKEKEREGKRVL